MSGLKELLKNNNLSLKLSIKELRGSFNEFKIVITSIFIGVFIITAVGSLSKNLQYEIDNKRSELLGGNFELSTTYQEFPSNIKNWLLQNGTVSQVIEMRTMLSSNKNLPIKRRVVELKAVDQKWPLIGEITVKSQNIPPSAINIYNHINKIFIDEGLKKQLNISIGDIVKLGNIEVEIQGIIKKEPDRMFSFSSFGSRVLISSQTLKNTGLVVPGSLIKYKIKFIPNNKKIDLFSLNKLIDGTNISIKTVKNSTNNFNNFIERTTLFISLVGLITLLISELVRCKGYKENQEVIPSLWIEDIQNYKHNEPYLNQDNLERFPNGNYRSKWYQTGFSDGEFCGIGIHGQNIWINPKKDLTIIRMSSAPDPINIGTEELMFKVFEEIAKVLD